MKIVALAIISMCLASAFGYERLWAKGDVLLSELQNGADELQITYFFDSTNTEETYYKVRENQAVLNDVLDYLKTISVGGEKAFPVKVFFSTVDATDEMNQNVIFKSGVKVNDLDDGPVLLALRLGKGYLQHGPKVVAALKNSVEKLRGGPAKP